MSSINRPVFDPITHKSLRFLFIGFMIVLCLLSSCTVRKGIQSFFSTDNAELVISGKTGKFMLKNLDAEPSFSDCKNIRQELVQTPSPLPKTAGIFLLAFLLPGFLLSLRNTTKDHICLPVPYSRLQWPGLSLFLQHRLLLI